VVIYKLALLKKKVAAFCTANKTLFKRRRIKKQRLQDRRSLIIDESKALKALKDLVKLKQAKISKNNSRTKRRKTGERRCSNCGSIGHNVRTCEIVSSSDKENESD
jgi:hypothetical protein